MTDSHILKVVLKTSDGALLTISVDRFCLMLEKVRTHNHIMLAFCPRGVAGLVKVLQGYQYRDDVRPTAFP